MSPSVCVALPVKDGERYLAEVLATVSSAQLQMYKTT